MDKSSTDVTTACTRYVKTAARRRKRLVFLMIALVLLGWFAYNNVSLYSDWYLNKNLLHRAGRNHGKTLRLELKELYPGGWEKVCFYGRYQGRQDILRDSGIDIQPTRARVWAGSESAMTFLFIYANGTVLAQRVADNDMENGVGFSSMLSPGHPAIKLPSCGDRDSVLVLEARRDPGWFDLVFYPSQGGKS